MKKMVFALLILHFKPPSTFSLRTVPLSLSLSVETENDNVQTKTKTKNVVTFAISKTLIN